MIFILFGVIIQIIVFTLLAVAIALPLAGIVCWRSTKHRKRNTILAALSPFVFIYTFYFTCLIGGFACASIFDTGCGMDGCYKTDLPNGYRIESLIEDWDNFTGYIHNDNKCVIEDVTKIKVSGDTIYGERHTVDEAQGSECYFAIDTKTDSISLQGIQAAHPAIATELTLLEPFYYDSWSWVNPLGIIAFVLSTGLVSLLWFVAIKIRVFPLISRVRQIFLRKGLGKERNCL